MRPTLRYYRHPMISAATGQEQAGQWRVVVSVPWWAAADKAAALELIEDLDDAVPVEPDNCEVRNSEDESSGSFEATFIVCGVEIATMLAARLRRDADNAGRPDVQVRMCPART